MAGGKSRVSAAVCAAVVDGGEEVGGGEEFSAAGSDAGDSGSFAIGGVDVAGVAEVSGTAESVGAISAPLAGSVICGVGAVVSELSPQLAANRPMAASKLAERMRFGSALCVAVVIYP